MVTHGCHLQLGFGSKAGRRAVLTQAFQHPRAGIDCAIGGDDVSRTGDLAVPCLDALGELLVL